MNSLRARAALAVDSCRWGRDREARGEPRVARDVQRLLAGLAHTSEDDILDLLRFDARAIDDLFQHERAEDDGMDLFQLAVAATYRRSHDLDNHDFAHFNVSLPALVLPILRPPYYLTPRGLNPPTACLAFGIFYLLTCP